MACIDLNRPIAAILADLLNQLVGLARIEGQLVRVEMSERMGEIGLGLGLVVAGSVLSIPALVILLEALVASLVSAGLALHVASFAVGGATLLIGIALLAFGGGRLKVGRLLPGTIRELQRDAELASQKLRSDNGIPKRAA
jgi:hypothetical protein